MNTPRILFAAAAALLAASCASTPPSAAVQASASATLYCHKDRMQETASGYQCNWATSVRDVCQGSQPVSTIAKNKVSAPPADGNRCETGLWMAQVTML